MPTDQKRGGQRRSRIWPFLNLGASVLVAGAIVYVSFVGAGPLPALGPAFNPTTGAWSMAADAQIKNETLHLNGLGQPVQVTFESDGTAHIVAQTAHDLFLATGYVHAKFRMFQMDLLRRQGAGRLSEVVGPAALDTDRFELQLGLLRTAQAEWNALPQSDSTRSALVAYAQGVNDRIVDAEALHQLDPMFTLLGYQPKPWSPIDTLLVKGDMTQTLNFTDTPLLMAQLDKALGPTLTAQWFPVLPPNPQAPYDPGPYPAAATAPIETMRQVSGAEAQTASILYDRLAALPAGLVATGGASNNWAVAAAKSSSGGALLGGDPHLHLTLPAIWFQLSMDAPGYHTSGVSIPGTPGVLIGHNQHIAWSLTDSQNQQTFFYEEQEDAAHPNQYFWNGAWHQYKTVSYDIPVLGGATDHLTVKLSVHGPVITDRGITTSVWWAGNLPSQDFSVLLRMGQARNFQEFRDALSQWYSPTHNFVYADDQGNIGLISAGYFPLISAANAEPWLPMPGTGEYDVTGTIPYDNIPQIYNPPAGFIWSANQRQVTADYPYYIGTASNFFDPGYRAEEIRRTLSQPGKLSAADMKALQTDTRDYLASEMVPILLQALANDQLTTSDQQARNLLANWNYHMDVDSAAASIWWTFWQTYITQSFDPWWKADHVKVDRSEVNDALGQDLESLALKGITVCPPAGCGPVPPCAPTVVNCPSPAPAVGPAMTSAFHATLATLGRQLGTDPTAWTWGRLHTRQLDNLAMISGLNYGPRPDRGDAYTPLAAAGFPSSEGPSWRMVVDWGGRTFSGIYPGGQSENPASTWYTNHVDTWWSGLYSPMLTADQAAASPGSKTWSLVP
jgi:penicillin G amidase